MLTIERPRPAKLGRSLVRRGAAGAAIALAVIGVAAVLRSGEPGRVLASWLEDATRVRRAIAAHLGAASSWRCGFQSGAVGRPAGPIAERAAEFRGHCRGLSSVRGEPCDRAGNPAPPHTTILELASPAPRASLQDADAVANPEPRVDPAPERAAEFGGTPPRPFQRSPRALSIEPGTSSSEAIDERTSSGPQASLLILRRAPIVPHPAAVGASAIAQAVRI